MHGFYQKPLTPEIDPPIQPETKIVMLLVQHNSFLTYLIICHHWYKVSLEEVKLQKTFLVVGPKQQRLLIAEGIISSKSWKVIYKKCLIA